jgi:outer membrane receptor protein involved in Fe transport
MRKTILTPVTTMATMLVSSVLTTAASANDTSADQSGIRLSQAPQDANTNRLPAVDFDIDAPTLSRALIQLTEQSGLQLIYPAGEKVTERPAKPLTGRYTPEVALKRLLEGSDLEYEFIDAKTISIIDPSARAAELKTSSRGAASATSLRLAQNTGPAAEQHSAQSSGTRDEWQLQEIIVTGTHIKGEEVKSAPRTQYSRDEIMRTGAANVETFLGTLPQNFGGGRNAVGGRASVSFNNVANNSNLTTANLRGLAVGSTLSLVNGRRMAPMSVGGDFDVSLIPLGAIERVEVVTDGASAIYGSDAIAGVVNFILRDRYEGAETSVQWGNAAHSDYSQLNVTQLLGHDWSSGGALLTYEYRDQNPLKYSDRSYSRQTVPEATLADPETRHAVMLSLNQEINDRTRVRLDTFYNERAGDTTRPFFADLYQSYRTRYLTFAPSLSMQLGGDWSMELSGVWGRTDEQIRATAFGQQYEFGDWNRFTEADAVVSGSLFDTPAGAIHAAVGAMWRNERQSPTGPGTYSQADRDTRAAFMEALIPLIPAGASFLGFESGQLSLAARYEDYDAIGSTTDPRVGLALTPTEGVNLRATWGTSFKAPAQGHAHNAQTLLLSNDNVPTLGPLTLVQLNGTVRDLKPERGESWTVGIDWNPPAARGFNTNVTYYNIVFDDRIASVAFGAASFLLNPDIYGRFVQLQPGADAVNALIAGFPPAYVTNFVGPSFDPASVYAIIDGRTRNIAATETSGIDFMATYTRPVGKGSMTFSCNVNRILSFDNQTAPGAPISDDLDVLYRPLDLRARVGVSWNRGPLGVSGFVNYADSYTNVTAIPHETVDSYLTTDVTLAYVIGPEGEPAASGLTLFFSVSNLFDEAPPRVSTAANDNFYDGANADPFGRRLSLGITRKW